MLLLIKVSNASSETRAVPISYMHTAVLGMLDEC